MSESKTLVTTMGGQAQVVTFALDWLLAQGEDVRDVIVVHLSSGNPRVQKALAQLAAEFRNDQYAGRACRFRHEPVQAKGVPLPDLCDEADAEATWQTVYNLIATCKSEGRTLHVRQR